MSFAYYPIDIRGYYDFDNALNKYSPSANSDEEVSPELVEKINALKDSFIEFYAENTNVINSQSKLLKTVKIALSNKEKIGKYKNPKLSREDREKINSILNKNTKDSPKVLPDNLCPSSKIILGEYIQESNTIILYIKSIYEAANVSPKVDFLKYIFTVLAHELFHCYHASESLQGLNVDGHDLIIETLATYAEQKFVYHVLCDDVLLQKIKKVENYSLLFYPYAGVKVINYSDDLMTDKITDIKEIGKIINKCEITAPDAWKHNLNQYMHYSSTRDEYNNTCMFKYLFSISQICFEDAERVLLDFATKYDLLF